MPVWQTTCTPQGAETRGHVLTGYKAKLSIHKTKQMESLILYFFILMTKENMTIWEAKNQ